MTNSLVEIIGFSSGRHCIVMAEIAVKACIAIFSITNENESNDFLSAFIFLLSRKRKCVRVRERPLRRMKMAELTDGCDFSEMCLETTATKIEVDKNGHSRHRSISSLPC